MTNRSTNASKQQNSATNHEESVDIEVLQPIEPSQRKDPVDLAPAVAN